MLVPVSPLKLKTLLSEFVVQRSEEHGGDAVFKDFDALEKAFEDKVKHCY